MGGLNITKPVKGASANLSKTPAVDKGVAQPSDALTHGKEQELPEGVGGEGEVLWSSHPILNYRLGKFHFEKGLLRLNSDDAAEFEKARSEQPISEQNRTRKLDVAAAERLVRETRQREPKVTSQTDSSSGERTDNTKAVGDGDLALGHAALSQQDQNAIVDINTNAPQTPDQGVGTKPAHEA